MKTSYSFADVYSKNKQENKNLQVPQKLFVGRCFISAPEAKLVAKGEIQELWKKNVWLDTNGQLQLSTPTELFSSVSINLLIQDDKICYLYFGLSEQKKKKKNYLIWKEALISVTIVSDIPWDDW